MIVVFDSSVWISALHFGESPLRAVEDVLRRHDIATCDEIIFEVRKSLVGKFNWSNSQVEGELSRYLLGAIRIDEIGQLHGICRDPNDDMILECAKLAGADLIITGDRDLLVLGSCQGTRILTVRQYLDL